MAFTSATTGQTIFGNLKVVTGTFTNNTGDVGGSITTGLNYIFFAGANNVTSHVGSQLPKVTTSGGTITIVNEDGADGTWIAFGR